MSEKSFGLLAAHVLQSQITGLQTMDSRTGAQ